METQGPCDPEGSAQRTRSPQRTGGAGSLRGHRRRRHQTARAGGSPAPASSQRFADRLANYRHLVDVLDSEIKRSKRTNREFAMLFFDLDGLKRINDRYGHMTGSQALCRLADVLCSCCRDIDTPARFGGDEFALVLPETNAVAAELVAERICESVANDGKGPKLSVSAGIAVYPQNGESIERLLSQADSALYSMKRERIAAAVSKHTAAGK